MSTPLRVAVVLSQALWLSACLGQGRDLALDAGPLPAARCPSEIGPATLDIPYASIPGVDPNLLSLDVYQPVRPASCGAAPIVIWVHGGGWAIGDKSNRMTDKVALFNRAGWILVSVNYRLSPSEPSTDPARVMFPTQPHDVASAIHWVREHAKDFGGDASRIAIAGHSAGAHLVALVSTDPQYLGAHGDPLSTIRCTASYDTEAYDLPATMADTHGDQRSILENAFGTDPAVQAAASPINYLKPNAGIPAFQIVSRGSQLRQSRELAFADALAANDIDVDVIEANPLKHDEVNTRIGVPGDPIMTPPMMEFLTGCLETWEPYAVQRTGRAAP